MSFKNCVKIILAFIMSCAFMVTYASTKLSFCGEVMSPYLIKSEANALSGIDVDILKVVLSKIQVDYEIVEMAWPKCEEGLKRGVFDAALGTSKNKDRESFLYYPSQISWSSEFVFFTQQEFKKKKNRINYQDIIHNNYRVGIIEKNSYHPSFWEVFPWVDQEKGLYHKQLEPSKNVETNILKLSKQRIDLYPQDKQIGLSTIKKLNVTDLVYYDEILFKKDYYFVFSKQSKYSSAEYKTIQELVKKFDSEIAIFKRTNQFKKLFLKYAGN